MVRKEIQVLSKNTIDQIAAGEVIERPASVVKELTENAIDAGASAISVEIKKGGISEIRITDNGCGIPVKQIHAAFLRHATSKLREAKELDSIHSLGFRGEALSSIAAVSMVTMITKASEEDFGSQFMIEGGEEGELQEIGAPDGTTFIVRNLFYNTPARKKFLKSQQTESGYVQSMMEHLALSHPEISFRFSTDGRERLQTSGNGKTEDVVYQIFGREIVKNLLPIEQKTEYYSLKGFLGNYTVNRGNRDFENFFVNGRLVEDKILRKAVEEGYRGFLMQHQFPFAVLFFQFPDGTIDVNVHPAKKEIRMDHGPEVLSLLSAAVHERLTRRDDIIEVTLTKEKKEDHVTPKVSALPFEEKHLKHVNRAVEEHAASVLKDTAISRYTEEVTKPVQMSFLSEKSRPFYRIIGQVFDTYWMFEYDGKLYILDQHAAHEKVNYERLMASLKNKTMTSQMVSPALIITLSNQEAAALEEHRSDIEALGFAFESFGGHEYRITATPGNLYSIDTKHLFMDLAAQAVSWKADEESALIRERVATIACKASIKGNQRISQMELEQLLDELLMLDEPFHCPHGRPTMVSLTRDELDKMFKRIVS
ncbi:MAG: DNA mismatch repair endonuclease MutL [Lachnospiraceae bacterium]|nr:DNA mismatch repair endonuclease MutL [Lachnospiraceae bacterium]